jgi:A/G-specific adenine glycosylase
MANVSVNHIAESELTAFRKTVWDFYREHGRHELPWRRAEADGEFDPYKILVSEIMLQQTQVARVIPKYNEFLAKFPDVARLAQASLGEVLRAWSGLGYNRRAKFLWRSAQMVVADFGGEFPRGARELQKLPGVGPNTAGAITAYAFNRPAVFVETNIRTVFIHHFFKHQRDIPDKTILELVEQTLDRERPRVWFWALVDYGAYLKQTVGNVNRASRSYAKQSKFAGSKRQLRGQVIRLLIERSYNQSELAGLLGDDRLDVVLDDLVAEKLIAARSGSFMLFA